MVIWLKEALMQILIWILGFIDSVFTVFRGVAGLDSVTTPNGEQKLSEYFLGLPAVQKGFWIIFIAALGICAVCTVVAIVKNIINAKGGEPKSHAKTIGQSISTVFVSLFMAMLLFVGVGVADRLLGEIDKSMNGNNDLIMSHEIISLSVFDGYEFDTDDVQGLNVYDDDGTCIYVSYLYEFAYADEKPKKEEHDGNKYVVYLNKDGTSLPFNDAYYQVLDENNNPVLDKDGKPIWKPNLEMLTVVSSAGGWATDKNGNKYTKNNLPDNIWNASVKEILGDHNSFVVPTGWKHDGMIADPDGFNFIIAYICGIVLLIALIGATFGLVKRLFDIVLLFIVLPGIAATIPLDDGAKFKLWRETVISKVFLAFGTVLAVNVFLIVAPSLLSVSIAADNEILNSVLRIVLICGGALTISGGQLLFARLLGTSAEESREMAQSARTLFGGAMTALGGVRAAGRLVFGAKNANGQRVGGLIKGGASALGTVGGGAVNAAGTLFGGQAYRGSKFASGVSATQRALRGFGNSSGWIGQDRTTGGATLGSAIGGGMGKAGGAMGNSKAGKKTGLNNGLVGGIKSAVKAPGNERAAAVRANDIAAAFGVDPKSVKHVPYGTQAANSTGHVGAGSRADVEQAAHVYAKENKKKKE